MSWSWSPQALLKYPRLKPCHSAFEAAWKPHRYLQDPGHVVNALAVAFYNYPDYCAHKADDDRASHEFAEAALREDTDAFFGMQPWTFPSYTGILPKPPRIGPAM